MAENDDVVRRRGLINGGGGGSGKGQDQAAADGQRVFRSSLLAPGPVGLPHGRWEGVRLTRGLAARYQGLF